VNARYQHQTWGGTSSPERRLTRNLGYLRNQAKANDLLLIERGLENRNLYRLTLIKAGTPEHSALASKVGTRRWGVLDPANRPVRDSEIANAQHEQTQHESKPLDLFDNTAVATETRVRRIARSKAFQQKVVGIYSRRCAVCGEGLVRPGMGFEVEAAHIVPRGARGADDARNGLALCRSHHWAFDRGLFGARAPNIIHVPKNVRFLPRNHDLAGRHNQKLRAPSDPSLAPAAAALNWHFNNVVHG
jgi:putative restriction endonuclease